MALNTRGLNIPFVSFGNVTSDNLFDPKEQEIFDFYQVAGKQKRYRRVLDIGANIGVHSILMALQGWEVKAFEPDPVHCLEWTINTDNNLRFSGARIALAPDAVSDCVGTSRFVRVLGNTTGSHLEGDKAPYGPVERFEVVTVDCRPLFDWADFAKIDCEGHEATLLCTITAEQLKTLEMMVEVGTPANAVRIWQHLRPLGARMWAQNRQWKEIDSMGQMPVHHSEGALFIGRIAPFEN